MQKKKKLISTSTSRKIYFVEGIDLCENIMLVTFNNFLVKISLCGNSRKGKHVFRSNGRSQLIH